MVKLDVNGRAHELDVDPQTPLLWVLRELLGMTGTKCGACSVHVDGQVMRSCQLPVGSVGGKVLTIEGLSADRSHPVQVAWLAHQVPQCGYCQSGQIMAAVALLAEKPAPTDAEINEAMSNICRCGTYQRIRTAIHAVAGGKA